MFQRIQTLYFIAAVIFTLLPLFGISLFNLTLNKAQIDVDAFQVEGNLIAQRHYFWVGLVLVLSLLIFTVSTFKNRKLQMKLGWSSLILLFVLTGWIVVTVFVNPVFSSAEKSIGLGIVFLFLAMPFIYFGIRGVKKDQSLIDSLNRLR